MNAVAHRSFAADKLRRDRVVAWSLLVLAGVVAAALWINSEEVASSTRRRIGNGTGYYTDIDRSVRTELVVASLAVGVAGIAGWTVLLFLPEPSAARRATILIGAATACAILAGAAAGRIVRGDPYEGQPRFTSTRAMARTLEPTGLACTSLSPADKGGLLQQSSVCRIPSRAALADGHDDVLLGIFVDDDAREEWLTSHPVDTVYAVTGPTWVTTCEFQATCAQIQHALGGRNR